MKSKSMAFYTESTKINKDIYRPSSNFFRFFKSLLAVVMIGQSPINTNLPYKR